MNELNDPECSVNVYCDHKPVKIGAHRMRGRDGDYVLITIGSLASLNFSPRQLDALIAVSSAIANHQEKGASHGPVH